MKITPQDGLTRFLVQSDVNPDMEYLVDLSAYDGSGACSCQHFEFRMQPELMLGKKAPKSNPGLYQCKHIKFARESLGKELVDTVTRTAINQDKQT